MALVGAVVASAGGCSESRIDHCIGTLRLWSLFFLVPAPSSEFSIHRMGREVTFFIGALLGIVAKQEGKMVLWSAQILEHVKVRTMPLNWRKERSHGRLGATLKFLGKMCRRH